MDTLQWDHCPLFLKFIKKCPFTNNGETPLGSPQDNYFSRFLLNLLPTCHPYFSVNKNKTHSLTRTRTSLRKIQKTKKTSV
mmetsp:Transcript_84694/g.148492  ORF Transcript_84694/g.148492 Transcript_84694/m.148492 type:complete len:81 (-) Transcript_84694:3916-4158(-)